jgi:tetratricopeptide (TPR) repeat protein
MHTPATDTAEPVAAPAARWLYGPWTDLVVGCAAWSAPLLLLSGRSMEVDARGWAVVFYALALVFNYPHYMATVYRAYHTRSEFARYRIFTVHLTVLLALVAIVSHAWSAVVPWIFTLYVTWSPWHYTGQNFGLLMMYARRNGGAPSEGERRALYVSFLSSYLLLFIGFHTGPSNDPLILSLGIPALLSDFARLALLLVFAVPGLAALVLLAKRLPLAAMLAPLALFAAQFVWFVAPAVVEWATDVRLSQARYSSGVLAIMHSAQYLWVTSYYARREAEAVQGGTWRPWSYAATLVGGGIALFVPGPWIASYLFRSDFTTSFLIFTAIVNIHHFFLDGAIWKLRDSRIASFLIDSQRRAAEGAVETGRAVQGVAEWLVSDRRQARLVRVATLAALALWAGIDQTRYLLATNDNLPALERAAALNPYDAALLARRERLLVAESRYQEAYDLYRAYLARRPSDADALARIGVLAFQMGRHEEAVARWQSALSVDPQQLSARRYLAQIWANTADRMDREGNVAEAMRAYHEAIAHDAKSGDYANAGADWFNYGQFLKKVGADPRLVAACLLRAEQLLASTTDNRLLAVRDEVQRLGREQPEPMKAAQNNLGGALADALRVSVDAGIPRP